MVNVMPGQPGIYRDVPRENGDKSRKFTGKKISRDIPVCADVPPDWDIGEPGHHGTRDIRDIPMSRDMPF